MKYSELRKLLKTEQKFRKEAEEKLLSVLSVMVKAATTDEETVENYKELLRKIRAEVGTIRVGF